MTLRGGGGGGGDPGPTRVICQRIFHGPEAICHSVFSRGWEMCHYGARGNFSPLPSEGEGEAGRAQISERNKRGNTRTALQIGHIPKNS